MRLRRLIWLPTGSRFSRRVRGMNDGVLYDPSVLELVEGRRKSGFKLSKPTESQDPADHETAEEVVTDESQENEKMNGEIDNDGDNNEEETTVDRVKRSLEFQSTDSSSKGI